MSKKKTNDWKLIRMLISNDKKITAFSILSLIVGFVFLLTVSSLSDTIIKTKQDNTEKTYGKFLVVVPEVRKSCEKKLKKNASQFVYEKFEIVGNVEYANKKITMGTMQESMGENLGFQKIKGKWPQTSNQIVVEEYLLELFGESQEKLPVYVTLQKDGESTRYEVTGVISNYSFQLLTPIGTDYKKNVYPSIICGKKNAKILNETLVIMQKKLNFKNADDDIYTLFDEIPSDNICANEHLYGEGYQDNKDMMNIRWLYIVMVNILLLLEQVQMIKTIFVRNQNVFCLYEALGMSEKRKRKVFFGWMFYVLFVSMMISYGIALLFGGTYIRQTFQEYSFYYRQVLWKQFLIEGGVLLVALLGGAAFYVHENRIANLKGIVEHSEKEQKKYSFQKFSLSIAVIQSICILFATASLCFADSFSLENQEIEYTLFSNQGDTYIPLNEYMVELTADERFSFDDLNELKKYEDFIHILGIAETNGSTLLLPLDGVDSYFQQYLARKEKTSEENAHLWKQISKQAKQYQAIDAGDISVVVLPQKEFQCYLQKNKIQNSALTSASEKSCILCLPNYNEVLSNPSVKEQNTILLGGPQGNQKNVEFCTEEFKVASVISCTDEESSQIQVVMSETVAKESNLVVGYDMINISMDKDTPLSIQQQVEQKIDLLMASIQGGMLDSTGARNERTLLIRKYTSVMSNTMLVFGILAIWIYISLSIYVEWQQNRHEYGVLRSFGMSYATLQRSLFAKYRNSLMVSCIFTYFFAKNTFQYNEVSNRKILIAIGITAVATYFSRIFGFWRNKHQSISAMISRGD